MVLLNVPMRLVDKQILHLPRWSTVVSVIVEDGMPCLVVWVRDDGHMLQPRLFRIVDTGVRFSSHGNLVLVGTFQIENLIGTVFEEQ